MFRRGKACFPFAGFFILSVNESCAVWIMHNEKIHILHFFNLLNGIFEGNNRNSAIFPK